MPLRRQLNKSKMEKLFLLIMGLVFIGTTSVQAQKTNQAENKKDTVESKIFHAVDVGGIEYAKGETHYKAGDFESAYKWIEKAAEKGHPYAKEKLRKMRIQGLVVNKDTSNTIEQKQSEQKSTSNTIVNRGFPNYDVLAPVPLGGPNAFKRWIETNYTLPKSVLKKSAPGRLEVAFVVEKDGSLSNFEVIKDVGYGASEELIRLLKTADNWIPGIHQGKVLCGRFILPVDFHTQDQKAKKKIFAKKTPPNIVVGRPIEKEKCECK